jgi:DNA-binding response OmpR family regulator/predicted regulator of Ras-like GTPase activity (Roadblock/LC7/MglB family)
MSKGRILVVDDELHIVRPCIKALKIKGYDAQGASDGRQALVLIEREPFDLLLLDLKMPGMNGLEVLRRAKTLQSNVAAIIITGYGTLEAAAEAMQLGAADFVSKPLDMKALVDKVQQALERVSRPESVVRGNLRSMSLTSIVSVTCNEGTQATLEIRHADRLARIFFNDGDIIHAELDGVTGAEVIYRILAWEEGEFSMTPDGTVPERTVHTGWSGLLLEGLRRIDEAKQDTASHLAGEDTAIGDGPPEWGGFLSGEEQEAPDYELDADFEPGTWTPDAKNAVASGVKDVLQSLSETLDGFVAASVIDRKGLVADLVAESAFSASRVSTILSELAQRANQISAAVEGGIVKENITATDKYVFITRPIGDSQHYARVIVTAGSNVGAARLYMQECEQGLLEIL